MTMGSVVQGEAAGLCGTQFPGWPDMFHFTRVVYPPSPNSVLRCEVSKVQDFRQPQPIGFVIQVWGFMSRVVRRSRESIREGLWDLSPDLPGMSGDPFLQRQAPPHTLHVVYMPHIHRPSWHHRICLREGNHTTGGSEGDVGSFSLSRQAQDPGHGEKGVFLILSEGTAATRPRSCPIPLPPHKITPWDHPDSVVF